MFLIIGIVLILSNISTGSNLVPEEEYCQWFFKQCPALKKTFRPMQNSSEKLEFSFVFGARRLVKMDDVGQTVCGIIEIFWRPKLDCLANFEEKILNSSLSIGAKHSVLCIADKKSTWVPRLRHSNAAEDPNYLEQISADVTIWRGGTHKWQIPGVFESMVDIDFRKFPFDQVTAVFEVIWLDLIRFINVSSTNFYTLEQHWPGSPSFIPDSSIWRFREPKIAVIQSSVADTNPLTSVCFYLERRQEYYIMTMFVPTEILMALQLATFIMPPNALDRATYSITVNLAFTVSQQVVNDQLPKTSQTIYLFYYIAVYLMIGAAVTIQTLTMGSIWESSKWVHKKEQFFNVKVCLGRIVDLSMFVVTFGMVLIVNGWYYYAVITG